MSRPRTDIPGRLLDGDATDFERRVIDAALEKRPSAAASARMARALGVTVTNIGTAAASKALAADAAASKAPAAAGTSATWPWVSVVVIGLVVAGAVVGARVWHGSSPASPRLTGPPAPAAALDVPTPPAANGSSSAGGGERTSSPAAPLRRTRVATTSGDLRDEIGLVDSARDALSVGSAPRALDILHRYQERYPSGSFRPEAAAIRIEALVKLGREAEARALAMRFVADHRGSLLATRVAELVGLAEPPVAP